jgi:HSP20 family protein
MVEKRTEIAPREHRGLARKESFQDFGNPFRILERFTEEMDRVFDDFGFGRSALSLSPRRGLFQPWRTVTSEIQPWAPDIDVFHRNNELVVRADLPGLGKDDVKVDVTEDSIIVQGERKKEHEEEREGVYHSERSYGSFYRMIPVPEGAITDQAKATFKDGVLEITMPAPPEQVRRGRRLEIIESAQPVGQKK